MLNASWTSHVLVNTLKARSLPGSEDWKANSAGIEARLAADTWLGHFWPVLCQSTASGTHTSPSGRAARVRGSPGEGNTFFFFWDKGSLLLVLFLQGRLISAGFGTNSQHPGLEHTGRILCSHFLSAQHVRNCRGSGRLSSSSAVTTGTLHVQFQ